MTQLEPATGSRVVVTFLSLCLCVSVWKGEETESMSEKRSERRKAGEGGEGLSVVCGEECVVYERTEARLGACCIPFKVCINATSRGLAIVC